MKFPIRAQTFEALTIAANPQSADIPQTIPYYFYDTQTFVDNTTTALTFFAVAQADRSLSNWPVGGVLPQPQFFGIEGIMLDLYSTTATQFVTTAAGGVVGAIDDLGLMLLTGRPRITLTLSSKDYGPFPLSLCHGTGGPTGFGWGTFTAEESLQYANNGVFDGGLYIGQAINIPPQVDFNVRIDWPAAVNISGDYRLRVTMSGVLSRRIS
jgi:hypothetical protein